MERLHKQQHESKRGWITVQGKELKKSHDPDKLEKLIQLRKSTGMWFESEDFPGDDDDTCLFLKNIFDLEPAKQKLQKKFCLWVRPAS